MYPTAVGAWTRRARVQRCRPGQLDGNSKGGKAREAAAVEVDGAVTVEVTIEEVEVEVGVEVEVEVEVEVAEVGVAVVAGVVEDTKGNLAGVEIDDSGKFVSDQMYRCAEGRCNMASGILWL